MKILILLSLLYSITGLAADGWELAKEADGITVYTRTNNKTHLKDFKAAIVIKAPIDAVSKHMQLLEEHTKWMHERKLSKVIKKIDNRTTIAYSITNAPWPVTDRDAVVSFTVGENNTDDHKWFYVNSVDGYVPVDKSMIRVPYIEGSWEMIKLGNDSTKLIFTNSASPGGSLPNWLADSFVLDMPFNSLNNFRAMLEGDRK